MPRKFDFISPGIQLTEVDQSILPAEVDADGPIVIGRFRKGPGMKPVKVKSLDDFVQVFGAPVPGGSSLQGDVWRDGANLSAPTYAAYAAQAWLASETSPVTVVRLMGDQSSNVNAAGGYAGWQLTNSQPSENRANNSTAYGLFVIDASKAHKGAKIVLATDSGFAAGSLELDNSKPTKIQFVQRAALGLTSTAAAAVSDGLKFEIDFDDDIVDVAANTVKRTLDGTGGVAKITCGINGMSSATDIMAVVAKAILSAINNGDIENIAVDDNADGTIDITNLSDSNYLLLGETCNEKDQFKITAAGTDGVEDDTDGVTTSQSIRLIASAGWAGANKASQALGEGGLAAVIYADSGYLALKGNKPGSTGGTHVSASTLIESSATNEFTLLAYNGSGVKKDELTFNFDKNSGKYIRNKLNTTPYKTNSSVMKDSSDVKTYWLGETFDRFLADKVTSTGAASQLAVLVPLHKADVATADGNWGYNRMAATEAKSGYFIDYHKGAAGDYDAKSAEKLFRVCCLHAGEQIQKEVLITIEDLKTPSNPTIYNFGTFTLKVITLSGEVLESYANLSFDVNSPNFISRRIGDMYMEWSDSDAKYKVYGEHANQSDYIRVELYDKSKEMKGKLPVGFFGPGRPKGFGVLAGDSSFKSVTPTGLGADFAGAFATGSMAVPLGASGSVPLDLNTADSLIDAVKFQFPSIPLRTSGSQGFSANPYKVHFGVRPKLSADSTINDSGYCDYIRPINSKYAAQQFNPSGDFEYSFIFSLDDIRIDAGAVTYESGSHKSGLSFTAVSGTIQPLFDLGVKQFAAPLFGGFDGFDVKQKEPLANEDLASTLNTRGDYKHYTLYKALDTVADSELVPANLLLMPGYKKSLVTNKMINLAESRKDMLAIIDLEGDYISAYESTSTEQTRLGTVDSAVSNLKNLSIDSSYAATYYPAVQIQDNINSGERVWVPSSVAGFGALAQSERDSELWFAPAGFNRGGLGNLGGPSGPPVIQARQRLDSSDRDKLYEVGINPIATFPNEGVVIFGQKTLQQTPSALDRINVRRLMIFIKAEIGKVARNLLFEPGVQATFNRFKSQAEPILASIQNRFGLTDYRIVLDETTTTPDLIDRNIMYAKVFLKPARAIEFIAIDFVITKSGAEFV